MKYKFLLLLLSISISLYAQEMESVSHYVFPDFQPGYVQLKNGTINNAKFNYNAASEEMVFDQNGEFLAIGDAILYQIDTVFVSNEKFVRLNNKFVKIIIDEPEIDLFVQHKCQILPPGRPAAYGGTSQTTSSTSISSLTSNGSLYKLKLPDDFKIIPYNVYWINRNEQLSSFSSIKQLKKIYRDKKRVIDDYLKKNDVKLENEQSIKDAISFMESH